MDWSQASDTDDDGVNPKQIIVVKTAVYDIDEVVEAIQATQEAGVIITLDMVMSVVETWAVSDFGCPWGHPTDVSSLAFYDEHGNPLSWEEE